MPKPKRIEFKPVFQQTLEALARAVHGDGLEFRRKNLLHGAWLIGNFPIAAVHRPTVAEHFKRAHEATDAAYRRKKLRLPLEDRRRLGRARRALRQQDEDDARAAAERGQCALTHGTTMERAADHAIAACDSSSH